MTGTLHAAVAELGALTVGEDPLRIEAIVRKLRLAAGDSCGPAGIFLLALSAIDTALWDIRARRSNSRYGNCSAARATGSTLMRPAHCAAA